MFSTVNRALRNIKLEIQHWYKNYTNMDLSVNQGIDRSDTPAVYSRMNFDFRIYDCRGRPSTRWTWHDEAPQEIQCAADEPSPILRQTMSYNKM
jgi:hypothetical protein